MRRPALYPDFPVSYSSMARGVLAVVTLAVLAGSVVVAAAIDAEGMTSDRFTDVPADHVFHDDISWLADTGITRGCNPPDNTMFCPDDFVSRGQMAAFLARGLDLSPASDQGFTDTDGVFSDDIDSLAAAGITMGCNPPDNTMFCPDELVTRGQMAAFLHRGLGDETPPTSTSSTTSTSSSSSTTSSSSSTTSTSSSTSSSTSTTYYPTP